MLDRFYNDLSLYRGSYTTNSFGAPSQTKALVGTIRGRINMPGLTQRALYADKYQVEDAFHLYCEITDIKNGDFIVSDGVEYEVKSNPKNTVGRNHHLKLVLGRIDSDV